MFRTICRFAAPLVLGAALVSSCSPRTAIRGNLLAESQIAQIKVGESTQSIVARTLGPPSAQSTFDKRIWYYIGTHEEKWAFMNPGIEEQRVVAIYFDRRGTVERIQRYNLNDARDVDLVSRETPTSGRSIGFFEQIFGNLGTGVRRGGAAPR